jgi:hypothetical protein
MTRGDPARAIKAYIAAKWRRPDNHAEIEDAASHLPEALRERIDDLGLEDAQLLRVPDENILTALDRNVSTILRQCFQEFRQPAAASSWAG